MTTLKNLKPLRSLTCLSLLLVATFSAALAQGEAEAEKPASPLKLTSVDVTPEEPTPETLCKLSVTLANKSDQPISALRFAVSVNGHDVPVYEKQVFLDVVPPGGEAIVPLYNFWVTETGRPLPEKGPLTVEVRVTDARWTKVEMEPVEMEPVEPARAAGSDQGQGKDLVETWTLLESLETLPAAVTANRTLRRP